MATGAEWMEHFKTLPLSKRKVLAKHIDAIMKEPMIKKEYGWTGLEDLSWLLKKENYD